MEQVRPWWLQQGSWSPGRSLATLTCALVLTVAPSTVIGQDDGGGDGSVPSYLHVLTADSGQALGDTIELDGVSNVIYFSDRPERFAGHESLAAFIEDWGDAPDSFGEDPPNAVLSVLSDDGTSETVLELLDADHDGKEVRFRVSVIKGQLPTEPFGPSALFVDSVGYQLDGKTPLCWDTSPCPDVLEPG